MGRELGKGGRWERQRVGEVRNERTLRGEKGDGEMDYIKTIKRY